LSPINQLLQTVIITLEAVEGDSLFCVMLHSALLILLLFARYANILLINTWMDGYYVKN